MPAASNTSQCWVHRSYDDLPVATANNTFSAIPLGADTISGSPLYVAVYPITGTNLYSVGNNTMIAQLGDPAQFAEDQGEEKAITVTLSGAHTISLGVTFITLLYRRFAGELLSKYRQWRSVSLRELFFIWNNVLFHPNRCLRICQAPNRTEHFWQQISLLSRAFPNPAFASLEISLQRKRAGGV